MATFKAPSLSTKDFLSKYPNPVVFTAQPSEFKVLEDPADLKAWERMLADDLGLKAGAKVRLGDEIHASGGTCCESGAPTNDCDQD